MKSVQRTFISLVTLVASFWLVGMVTSSPASAVPSYADRMESATISATNHTRLQRDRRAVRSNACVDRMAESWARHLAQTRTLVHRQLGRVLSTCNRSYVSENLARYPISSGMTAAEVARSTVRAWMRSAEHRHNLLSSRPHVIGLGVARGGKSWFIVQNFAR